MNKIQATIARLEGQVSRYKAAADHYESSEDTLKADKRRLQREVTCLNLEYEIDISFTMLSIFGSFLSLILLKRTNRPLIFFKKVKFKCVPASKCYFRIVVTYQLL